MLLCAAYMRHFSTIYALLCSAFIMFLFYFHYLNMMFHMLFLPFTLSSMLAFTLIAIIDCLSI